MKKNTVSLLTLSMFFSFSGFSALAEVREIRKMAEILPYATPGTLIVFDLDNTVMATSQTLGSDQWFDSVYAGLIDSGLTKEKANEQAIALWQQVQAATRMKTVESTTPRLIRTLQSEGFSVMALTARPQSLVQVTQHQLKSIGINLPRIQAIGPGLSKGDALVDYLTKNSIHPSRVIFVDDKAKHTQTVNEALDRAGIKNYEFRYGAADAEVKGLDLRVAGIELGLFESDGILISDQEALQIIAEKSESK